MAGNKVLTMVWFKDGSTAKCVAVNGVKLAPAGDYWRGFLHAALIVFALLSLGCAAHKPVRPQHTGFDSCSAVSVDARTKEQTFVCLKGQHSYTVKVLCTQ